MQLSRGLRNNNPLNIENGIAWDGLAADGTDERFCEFVAPEMGIRAACKIFITYKNKYGITTLEGLIARWAPPIENDTEAYINNVCKWSGMERDEEITYDATTLSRIASAMARMENGTSHWPKTVYAYGAHLALEG